MSGRPKEYDDQKVIEAAMNVFWDHGYEASGTQALCEETGMGRGSLYHAFGNKQGLYQKALQYYQEMGINRQKDILSSQENPKQKLLNLLNWGIEIDQDPENPRGCLALHSVLERSHKDPQIQSINQQYLLRLELLVKAVITEGVKQAEFPDSTNISTSSKAFLSGYYGLRIMGVTLTDRDFLNEAAYGIISKI
ncbi:TetR/AcrR family transcriptional regulator [Proteus terrae]|uniref:TetR/AcrR family transcriptional regulator n=1 Tax=Proteus terrae TaxID=1574161 RepID=UPI0032DBC3AE